jgi:hypothetical protein
MGQTRTIGIASPWDSLPDCQHPVAWAYLARGVLHLISRPTPRSMGLSSPWGAALN